MSATAFVLHGLEVHLRCPEPGLRQKLSLFLDHLGLRPLPAPTGEPDLVLELCVGPPPAGAWPGPWETLSGAGFEVPEDRGRLEARAGETHISIDPVSGRAEGRIRSTASPLNMNLVSHALLSLLRDHNLYPLHAAGLVRAGRGLLIVGDSGCGKSTLAAGLLAEGWSILGDDSLLLRPTGDTVEALHLRRDLYLAPDHPLSLRAGLPASSFEGAKLRIEVEALFPGASCERCTPAEILFPTIVDRAHSRLQPCDPEEALHLLAHHSLVTEMDSGRARAHLDTLAALLRRCRCRYLEAGRVLKETPGLLGRMAATGW